MKTEALKEVIVDILTPIVPKVSVPDADVGGYPYATFEFDEYPDISHRIPVRLEINVFDYGINPKNVDEISDKIQAALDGYDYIDKDIQFISYKGGRNIVREDDKKILRRRLLFELSLYERR